MWCLLAISKKVIIFFNFFFKVNKAIVLLKSSDINGTITFEKSADGVKVSGVVNGLAKGKHGFHIHEKGDLGDDCKAAGAHFNPAQVMITCDVNKL